MEQESGQYYHAIKFLPYIDLDTKVAHVVRLVSAKAELEPDEAVTLVHQKLGKYPGTWVSQALITKEQCEHDEAVEAEEKRVRAEKKRN